MAPAKKSAAIKGKQAPRTTKSPGRRKQSAGVNKNGRAAAATQKKKASPTTRKIANTKTAPTSAANGSVKRKKSSAEPSLGEKPKSKGRPSKRMRIRGKAAEEAGSFSDSQMEHLDNGTPKMPILQEKTKRIPIAILEKFDPLPEEAQQDIVNLLKAVERPVYMTYRNDRRREEAQQILRLVVRKLCNKLAKAPAPPILVKDKSLKFDKIVEHNREMEATLGPDLHQLTQLQAEIEKEQVLLERDRKACAMLRTNAGTERVLGRKQARKFHSIVGEPLNGDEVYDGVYDFKLLPSKLGAGRNSSDLLSNDEEVLALTEQLHQHLENIQKNTGALEPVGEWMKKTRAAIDEVFCTMEYDGFDALLNEV